MPNPAIKSADDYVRRVRDQIEMIQYIRGRIGEDRSTILDMGCVPDHGTGLSAPLLAGQKRVPDSPEYSPVTSEDDEPTEPAPKRSSEDSPVTSEDDEPAVGPALKRPKGDITVIDSRSFSPMTGPDQDSPVSGIKTEAQAGDLLMAEIASRLTRLQEQT